MGEITLMPTNDFKPFATGSGANVMSQADWVALAALATGFQSGKASSAQINKAIRQALFIASALAQYTADKSGQNVLDDGNVAGFITKMHTAFGADFQPLDATLTAIAALTGAANKLAYFNGPDTAALTDLTSVGRDIIGKSTIADVVSYLGLGTGRLLGAPQIFTSSGTYTPSTGTKFVYVELIGAGGAGGGAVVTNSSQVSSGTGGTAGSYGAAVFSSDFSGVSVTVGTGGVGVTGATGGNGGTSSFGALLSCPGGNGGTVGTAGAPSSAAGGLSPALEPTGATVIERGEGGWSGVANSLTNPFGGRGGRGWFGCGAQPSGPAKTGTSSVNYGAGGGGACNANSAGATFAGGSGGNGLCIIWEYA
ncbi:hypothetical protein [Enterobacter cloacae complex sp. BZL2003]|uniref:glycine-rich domain-containing protein n=1 Tax=unclassified Enterobacter cloacae complex TaxID=2757714 RepID=UPI003BA30198